MTIQGGIVMTGIILYQSKYGATKKYATWLSQQTGFSCMETKKATVQQIETFDVIVLGGGIYASGIAGLSFLKKNIHKLHTKKIITFCVGASPYEENMFQQLVAHNFKGDLSNIPCFYCRGAWDMDTMNFVDKNLCKLLRKTIEKKNPEEYEVWEKALMEAGDAACDWTDERYLQPIIAEIHSYENTV